MIETLENFMSFCDDMTIANEAINIKNVGKKIWEAVKRGFRKIVTWFKNILLNINYFKNAQLNDELNRDLLGCLKVLQPKTERTHFTLLATAYDLAKIVTTISGNKEKMSGENKFSGGYLGVTGNDIYVSRETDWNDQIFLAMQDIDACIEAVKSSDPYKRIIDNQYDNKNIKNIPLSNIIPDLKNCYSKTTKFENAVSKSESTMEKYERYPKALKLEQKMVRLFQKIIQYYTFRISLLAKYLTVAKASVTGTIANIKEKKNKEANGRVDNKAHQGIRIISFFTDRQIQELKDLYTDATNAQTYKEYKPYYDKIVSMLKIGKNDLIEDINFSSKKVVYVPDKSEKIAVSPTQELFHTSNNENITQLIPRWTTPSGVLFPTPRVYFHMSNPLNRYGNKVGSGKGYYGQGSVHGVYKPKRNPSYVCTDREMGRTAVYIITNDPIPVEKVNYEDWVKTKNIKLGLND